MVQHHEDDRDAAQAVQCRDEACLGPPGHVVCALSDFEVGANGREHRLRDSPVAERRQVQAVDADVGVHVRRQGAEQVDQHRAFAARDLAQSIVDGQERGRRDLDPPGSARGQRADEDARAAPAGLAGQLA